MRRGLLLAVILATINTSVVFAAETPVATFISTAVSADWSGPEQEIGTFRIKFRVTAPDQDDIYLRGIRWPDNFAIFRNGMNVVNPPVTSILLASGNMSEDNPPTLYEIQAGESRDFEFMSVLVPKTYGLYACQLNRLEWALGPNGPANRLDLNGDFTTSYLALRGTPEPATLALLGLALPLVRRRR